LRPSILSAKAAFAAAGAADESELTPGRDDAANETQITYQPVTLEESALIHEKPLPVLKATEEQCKGCDLPAMELSPEINAVEEEMPGGAEAACAGEISGEPAKDRTAGGTSNAEKPPETVNDNISAGFAAKANGDMASALVNFMNAFTLNREPHAALAIAVEISNVYLELGQYPQAKLFIKSLLEQEHFNVTSMRQQLEERLLYLETFTKLLQTARIPKNAPYSKVPNLVKLKANIDTGEKRKINQGGI
jgi:tetratricopeptide (TPR) repeat protein